MMFFKSALTLSTLLVLASAMTLERSGKSCLRFSWEQSITHAIAVPAHEQMSISMATDAQAGRAKGTQRLSTSRVHPTVPNQPTAPSFTVSRSSDCEQEDEDDCTEFCSLLEQTATCRASGNKVTCFCKGGKSESNCEERCLLCMSREPLLSVMPSERV
jgi:hypothetical protein